MIAAGFVGIFGVLIILRFPEVGFYVSILASAFIAMPERLGIGGGPLGLMIEAITYLAFLSIIAKQYRERVKVSDFWQNPISVMFILIIIYYFLSVLNPEYHSKMGWFNFVRKQISYLIFYYMAFVLLNSYEKIKKFIKFWLVLAFVIGLYGVKQQWVGLAEFEMDWLRAVPIRYELFYQSGFIRKFSFLNDPGSFGVLCASTAVFTLVLAIRETDKKRRRLLWFITAIMAMASSASGTRTCNLMIVAGILAYAVFTLNERRTSIMVGSVILLSGFLLFGPFQNNPLVFRIKTTFEANKDASASVRDVNRHFIQPYIHDHPIGGGLNTCGVEGEIYNVGHTLAGFPPDSGYMKILLEQGWIGFALHLIFYFIFLYRGIYGFFTCQNPRIKTIYIALTICLFALIVGQYSQVAISQYPQILFYFPALVILYKLKEYDTPIPENEDKQLQ
ncbi:MAG: O-antigen ligase family protein [Gemmatimonadaceae bacterium]|nr:O-antigen ligase family protein [Chitinophagaceae bacterium]